MTAPPTGAITPNTGQAGASAEQTLSPQPAVDSTLPRQHQQTSREYRSSVSAIDDLSELELDADIATGVSATVGTAPQPPAPAASQKRPTCQAPLDLTSPTIPSAKKHKIDDGSTSAQLAMSAQQLVGPLRRITQPAFIQCQVAPLAPSSEADPSMLTMASIPPHERSQKADAVPSILIEATDAVACKMTLPQYPHAAASNLDSFLDEAPQQLVLSIPASNTRPSATAAFATVSCQLPAALSSAAAQQLLGTSATAKTSSAGKKTTSQPSVALLSRSLVTFHPHPNPTLPSDLRAHSKQAPSSYRPVIEELPPDSTPTAPTTTTAAAKRVLPSKSAMVIDIDSDDDHNVADDNQPAASLQDRQGQDDKLAQSNDSIARLSSRPALLRDHASEAHTPVKKQAYPSMHPTPTATALSIKQATAVQMTFTHPSAPMGMGMGHIFSSFSAFEDLSDAEEEDAGTESAAAASRAAGQLQDAGPAGGYNLQAYVFLTCHSTSCSAVHSTKGTSQPDP